MKNINTSVNNIDGAVKPLSQDIMSITQDINKDFVDMKDEINANIKEHIKVMNDVLKEEINRSNIIIKDRVTVQMANWNYNMSSSLAEQADKMSKLQTVWTMK